MKNINIFNTGMFPYLEGEEIKGKHLTLTILDMRTEELKSHKGAKENKEVLYFKETKKGFVLNKTNAKRIAQMYGGTTGHWEGKQITLTTEEVIAFGEVHNALRVVLGAIGQDDEKSDPLQMDKHQLLNALNKYASIRGFFANPDEIMTARDDIDDWPDRDDIDGWRTLLTDAKNHALEVLEDSKEFNDGEEVETNPEDWPVEGTYNTPTEAERHAQLSSELRERKETADKMTDEERSNRATELMAENGDDDPLGEQPELSASMEASSAFWEYADNQGIAREEAGKFLQETSSDFDKALELMKKDIENA